MGRIPSSWSVCDAAISLLLLAKDFDVQGVTSRSRVRALNLISAMSSGEMPWGA
jgi:hypothetical protein